MVHRQDDECGATDLSRGGRWDREGRKGSLHMYEQACLCAAVRAQTLFRSALMELNNTGII